MAPASDKKPRAVPKTNPFGLSARDVEIMIYVWKCLEEPPKIDKQKLARLTNLGNSDSAGRQVRRIMAVIKEAMVEADTAPSTPNSSKGGDGAAAAEVESPSVIASDKKKNKKAAAGKVAGRKRTVKEVDDGGSGDEDDKNEGEGGERPKKMPKHFKGNSIADLKLEVAEGGGEDQEAGEV